jgi:hypothetical protein
MTICDFRRLTRFRPKRPCADMLCFQQHGMILKAKGA